MAIVQIRPDRVVVITSDEGRLSVEEVVEQAVTVNGRGASVEVHTIRDPFAGFDEGRSSAGVLVEAKGEGNAANPRRAD